MASVIGPMTPVIGLEVQRSCSRRASCLPVPTSFRSPAEHPRLPTCSACPARSRSSTGCRAHGGQGLRSRSTARSARGAGSRGRNTTSIRTSRRLPISQFDEPSATTVTSTSPSRRGGRPAVKRARILRTTWRRKPARHFHDGDGLDRRPQSRRRAARRDRGETDLSSPQEAARVPAHAPRHPRLPGDQRRQPGRGLVPVRCETSDHAVGFDEASAPRGAENINSFSSSSASDRHRDRAPEEFSRPAGGSSGDRGWTRRPARPTRSQQEMALTIATSRSRTFRRSSSTTCSSRASGRAPRAAAREA